MEHYYHHATNVKKKKKEMRYHIWMNKGSFVIKSSKRPFWKDNSLFHIQQITKIQVMPLARSVFFKKIYKFIIDIMHKNIFTISK